MTVRRRRSRAGKGLLPPNPTQWAAEHNGLDLREELGLRSEEALAVDEAFSLMPRVRVSALSSVPLAQRHIDWLTGDGAKEWSGAAIPLPDEEVLVVYNDIHPETRSRATLMEEFFHLRLGHPPSTVRVHVEAGRRIFDPKVEGEAYASGCASLVPFRSLRECVRRGDGASAIARQFNVSTALVDYRLKVTRLWRLRARTNRRAG